jgi:hypothetical protein
MPEIEFEKPTCTECDCCGNRTVGLTDAHESPRSDVTFMGEILNPDEAVSHEWIQDVFHITDHMVADDKEIARYFSYPET